MLKFEVNCESPGCGILISNSFAVSENDRKMEIVVNCSKGHKTYLLFHKCFEHNNGACLYRRSSPFPETFLLNCDFSCYEDSKWVQKSHQIETKVSSRVVVDVPPTPPEVVRTKKLALGDLIKNMLCRGYPKLVRDLVNKCPECNTETIWYNFTTTSTTKS